MNIRGSSWEAPGWLLVWDGRRRKCLYERTKGPLANYPCLHIRDEGKVIYYEKPLLDAETFPQELIVKEKTGVVTLFKIIEFNCLA